MTADMFSETPVPVAELDEPPVLEDVPEDESPDICQIPGCNESLVYGGRGRRPRFCDEHKPNKSKSTVTKRRTTAWQANLHQQLLGTIGTVGIAVMAFNQFDGMCVMNGADNLAKSLVGVAEINPSVRKALEAAMTATAWSSVAVAIAGIAIPIAANHGVLPEAFKNGASVPGGAL